MSTGKTTDDRVGRLPVWAQNERELDKRKIARLEGELAALRNGTPTTVGVMPSLAHSEPLIPVAPQFEGDTRPTVQFVGTPTDEPWPDEGWLHARVNYDQRTGEPWLEVRGQSSLLVRTSASNCIEVKIGREEAT